MTTAVRSPLGIERAEPPRTRRTSARLSNFPVPEETLACIALGLWWRHRRGRDALPSLVALASGALTVAVGAAVVVQAWRSAGEIRLSEPEALVRDGPFARSRNPMYLGWGLMHVGLATYLRSPELFATVAPALALMHRQVLREERTLAAGLGAEYAQYRRSVPRYVGPGVFAPDAT